MAQEPQGKFFDRVKSLDLYLLLEVEPDVDAKALKKAYRKKALTCHPDKNPGNKAAVELFHQLSDALEVLSDEKTRAAYDNLLKARKAAELRNKQLDGKRRKLMIFCRSTAEAIPSFLPESTLSLLQCNTSSMLHQYTLDIYKSEFNRLHSLFIFLCISA